MEIKPAERISGIKPYFFASLEKTIAELRKNGMDVIRLDMGSPDLPPQDFIIESLVDAARRPDTHGYGLPGGLHHYGLPLRPTIWIALTCNWTLRRKSWG